MLHDSGDVVPDPIASRLAPLLPELTAWRRDWHRHPETAFEEHRTARLVAERLTAFGYRVATGIAGTGVVGSLDGRTGGGSRAIALRADMDALPMTETTGAGHASCHPGKMHACGHDGHMAMLLGAAKLLAETRQFHGTVHVIFQPGEEHAGGAKVMIEEGLFDRFPVEAVFGLHNWPSLPLGRFAIRPGPMLAAADRFDITLTGAGGHAAMPHLGHDPIVAAAALTMSLQTLVSRTIDPNEAALLSVTQITGGTTYNVIPEQVQIRGTVRSYTLAVQDRLESGLRTMAEAVATAHGTKAAVTYHRDYPPLVNDDAMTERAAAAAAALVGLDKVDRQPPRVMGSEDFAFMLQRVPGAYMILGTGEESASNAPLHSPDFDFNDAALALGVRWWLHLVAHCLPLPESPNS